MRAVLDTNVIVSGIISNGVCRQILRLAERGVFFPVTSDELAAELTGVLTRRFKASSVRNEQVREMLSEFMRVTPDVELTLCRDPADNRVLEAAVIGRCDYIVTGDEDLLVLKAVTAIPILRPADFLAIIGS